MVYPVIIIIITEERSMSTTQQVYVPTGALETVASKPVERPKSLKDLRVGLLDNGKEFSDVVLEALTEVLRRDHGVTSIKFWRKGFPAKGAPFIDAMVAVNLEKAGVPTVALISRSFCPLAQIVARGVGLPTLPIIMLPHPIGDPDPEKISRKGVDAAAECVRLLTASG